MEEGKSSNKGMMMIIMVLLVVIIAALAAGFIFLFSQINADAPEPIVIIQDPPPQTLLDITTVNLSNPINTNLYQSPGGSRHFVRMEVSIGINNSDPEAAEEFIALMMAREAAIMDRINNILRRSTREELSTMDGQDLLAERIVLTLQDAFDTRLITAVFISNLVVQ